jgi:Zinc knuckle
MPDIAGLVKGLRDGKITGKYLSELEQSGLLTKSERRKITKKADKPELTPRQLLRRQVKEKKSLPKIGKDERRRRYLEQIEKERENDQANFTICLNCRKRGHSLKNCPKANGNADVCFNCGSEDHTLYSCPNPRCQVLPFAKCFICKEIGHISRDCPENPNGLYPKGGCCHICSLKTHLAKDCPDRTEEDAENARKRRLEKDEAKYGPRVAGLLADSSHGGDALFDLAEAPADDSDDDSDQSTVDQKTKKKKNRGR